MSEVNITDRDMLRARGRRYAFNWALRKVYDQEVERQERAVLLREKSAAQKLVDGLVSSHISDREGKNLVQIYEGGLKVKIKRSSRSGGGVRGKVRGFSPAARGRMLLAMAETRGLDLPGWVFPTLTMPDDFPDPEVWQELLNVFLKRVLRKFPGAAGFWKKELKRRKSGSRVGEIAPHFHLLLHMPGAPYTDERLHWLREWFSKNWYEVVGSGNADHLAAGTNVRTVYNRAHAARYVCKYTSKSSDGEDLAVGRRWGTFGDLDRLPVWVGELSYQAVIEFKLLLVGLLQVRRMRWADNLARSAPGVGFKLLGVGAGGCARASPELYQSDVMRLLRAAVQMADEKINFWEGHNVR